MKSLIFILTVLILYSCAAYKNTKAQHISYKDRFIITDNDTLIVKQDSVYIIFYTNNYKTEYEKFYTKENRGEILRAIEYQIVLSPESLKMIENDGRMATVLKNILSKRNFDKIGRISTVFVDFIISLDDLTISEYRIRIYKDFGLSLSNDEVKKLFAYCKKMRFIYKGMKFKNETVPAGYFFPVIKKKVAK